MPQAPGGPSLGRPAMSPTQLWALCAGRWRLIAALWLLVLLLVMGAGAWRPPLYTATATLVLDPRPDPLAAAGSPAMGSASFMATQVDVMRSPRVLRQAVQTLPAPLQADWRARWQADAPAGVDYLPWAMAALESRLVVRPAREGGVVAVSYTSADATQAAEVANTLVRAYDRVAIDLRLEPARAYARIFEDRSRAARTALEEAQQRLSAFQKDKGIAVGGERLDIEDARLSDLSAQLTALQALSADSASRSTQAQGLQAERLQEVLGSPAINQIKADKGRAEAQLQQLSTRLGDRHPQVQELRVQLADMQQRLEAETRRVAGGVGLSDRINQQRVAALRAALDKQRDTVLRLRAVRDEALVLQREVEQAQRGYDALQQRWSQAALEGENTRGHVSLLSAAEPPIEPSTPGVLLRLALGLVLGGLLALGAVLALEWRQRRVRSAEDVVHTLQLPLLASMPREALQRTPS